MTIAVLKYWILAAMGIGTSYYVNKGKTKQSLYKSKIMVRSMMMDIIGILMIIGVIMAFIPMELITKYLGNDSQLGLSLLGASIVGGITIIPAFIAFPLVAALQEQGANIMVITAFLTTLTMVGVATMKIEIGEFGRKFTFIRNSLSFILAIAIAITMGVIL
ncbi:MAG: permease [Clostridiales bacterium]|nr:permease [Clostridiales bacterium]